MIEYNRRRTGQEFLETVGQDLFDEISQEAPQPYDQYVTAYEFFDVFKKILEDLFLVEKDKEDTVDKFIFLDEYPDTDYQETDFVVYNLGRRQFFDNKSTISGGTFKQSKPLQLASGYDIVNNNIVTDFAWKFSTEVRLEIFSISSKQVEQLTKFIESVILKHRKHLKLFVENIVYVEQSATSLNQGYFEKRLFSRIITLQLVTNETYSLVSEELKYFN